MALSSRYAATAGRQRPRTTDVPRVVRGGVEVKGSCTPGFLHASRERLTAVPTSVSAPMGSGPVKRRGRIRPRAGALGCWVVGLVGRGGILGPRGRGWPAWPQPGGACGPPCRGRGPVRRWPEPAPGRPHHPAPPAGSRHHGLAAPGWRRPRLGRSRPATPGPACPPSRWLAPGRGGRSGPSAGLRPAARGPARPPASRCHWSGADRAAAGPPRWAAADVGDRAASRRVGWSGGALVGLERSAGTSMGPPYRRCQASGTTTLFAELWLGKAHHALAIRRSVVAAGGLGSKLCLRMKIDGRPPVILTTPRGRRVPTTMNSMPMDSSRSLESCVAGLGQSAELADGQGRKHHRERDDPGDGLEDRRQDRAGEQQPPQCVGGDADRVDPDQGL
jgi:hypothetical protein